MHMLAKVAIAVVGAGGLTAVGVAGYRYNQRRTTANVLAKSPAAGNIFSFLGQNAKNFQEAMGRPVGQAAAEPVAETSAVPPVGGSSDSSAS